jgi:hypothetical protein
VADILDPGFVAFELLVEHRVFEMDLNHDEVCQEEGRNERTKRPGGTPFRGGFLRLTVGLITLTDLNRIPKERISVFIGQAFAFPWESLTGPQDR